MPTTSLNANDGATGGPNEIMIVTLIVIPVECVWVCVCVCVCVCVSVSVSVSVSEMASESVFERESAAFL